MRAAIMRSKSLVIGDAPEPRPGPGHVLVRTIACGICGTDLHALERPEALADLDGFDIDPARDVVMGHEFCAQVLELGPGVTGLDEGDTVVSLPVLMTPQGMARLGYSNDHPGGFAEKMLLQGAIALKVPAGLDPRHAALTEPMTVGLHAVNKSGITPGESALVLGCGPIGLACIAALKTRGIEPIVATDFSSKRRAVAAAMGASIVVDPNAIAGIDAWHQTGSTGSLVIFEAVGVRGMVDAAMRDAPKGARIVVVGVCMEHDTFRPIVGVNKELEIRFVLGYTPPEFSSTLAAIARGDIDVSPMITGSVGLEDVPGAFRSLADPDQHVKILVEPGLTAAGSEKARTQ